MDYYYWLISYILFSIAFILTSIPLILSHHRTSLPPGTTGWPVFGETLAMAKSGPEKFTSYRMKTFSNHIFKTSLLGQKIAVFCGPAGNKFLFSNNENNLTTWYPKSAYKILTGQTISKVSTIISSSQMNLLHQFLKPESLKNHISIMDASAIQHVTSNWTHGNVVNVFPLARQFTLGLACRILMGLGESSLEEPRLAESFAKLNSVLYSIPVDFPGMEYRRAVREGAKLRDMMQDIISRREEENNSCRSDDNDFMWRIMTWLKENNNGSKLSRDEKNAVVVNLIGLLFASYDTTSSALTFALSFIAELPHVFQRVYEEQIDILKCKKEGELLNWEDIQKMKYTWNVIREALRIVPPAQGHFREAINDFNYAGFTIPKGWKTYWTTYSTHKNPEYFPEPEKFDPSRFEGQGPAPFTFVPFGGGTRMCPGKEYARLEIMVFIHRVVTQFKLEKVIKDEKIVYRSSPIPAHGLPLRLSHH